MTKNEFVIKVSEKYFNQNSVSMTHRQFDTLMNFRGTFRRVKIATDSQFIELPVSEFLRSKKIEKPNYVIVRYGALVKRRNLKKYDVLNVKPSAVIEAFQAIDKSITSQTKPSFLKTLKTKVLSFFRRA